MIQLCAESVRMGAEGMDRIRKNTNDSACVKSYVNMKMELRIHIQTKAVQISPVNHRKGKMHARFLVKVRFSCAHRG